jgi:hypothetical protein
MKLRWLPKIKKGSILTYRVPPLWPTYIGETRTTFAKAYEIKVGCYWELFGEHVRNLEILGNKPPFPHLQEREASSLQGDFSLVARKLYS